jgi:predicted O-methyltransferase YrrM
MTNYNDRLSNYITELFAGQDGALKQAREESVRKGLPAISVTPEEGRFLQFLVRACGVRNALEIGTLGGYSGIWIARGLAPGGKLITLEKDPYHAQVAQEHFVAGGVAGLVEIRVGNAHQLLSELVPEGPFDFVFIDAEKEGYNMYFDWALANTRLNGVIAAHNAFRGGSVVGDRADDAYTKTMRSFNQRVAEEPRVISIIYPAGDGTLLAVRIS